MSEICYLYMLLLKNSKGKQEIYVGITNNLSRRYRQHLNGVGGRYTSGREVLAMIYNCQLPCRSNALILEGWLKKSENRRVKLMVLNMIPWTKKLKARWTAIKREVGMTNETRQ